MTIELLIGLVLWGIAFVITWACIAGRGYGGSRVCFRCEQNVAVRPGSVCLPCETELVDSFIKESEAQK